MLSLTRQLDNPLRGFWGEEPQKLNKITGCESRTVPPLYVLIFFILGESQSLEFFSGKADEGALPPECKA